MSELLIRGNDSPGTEAEFATELAELALSLQRENGDESATLGIITERAVELISGAEAAAVVSSAAPGRLIAHATRGELPSLLITVQNEVGEGPILDAVAHTTQVLVRDVSTETRWPRFTGRAARLGVGSVLCTPLSVDDDHRYGSLSLSATTPGAFDEESQELARVFATHAAIALRSAEFRRTISSALRSRDVIGQAKGIMMERYQLTQDEAFALLVRISQHSNRKLRDVCADLGSLGELPAPVPQSWVT